MGEIAFRWVGSRLPVRPGCRKPGRDGPAPVFTGSAIQKRPPASVAADEGLGAPGNEVGGPARSGRSGTCPCVDLWV